MKKLLLGATFLALSSTTVLAGAEDTFYITGGAGLNMSTEQKIGYKSKDSDLTIKKFKGDIGGYYFLGGGYNMNENFRFGAEAFYTNPKYKILKIAAEETKYKPNLMGVMATAYGVAPMNESFEIFLGGGVGYSRLSGEFENKPSNGINKKSDLESVNLLAGKVSVGMTYKFEDVVNLDLQYRLMMFSGDKKKMGDEMRMNNVITIGLRKDL